MNRFGRAVLTWLSVACLSGLGDAALARADGCQEIEIDNLVITGSGSCPTFNVSGRCWAADGTCYRCEYSGRTCVYDANGATCSPYCD